MKEDSDPNNSDGTPYPMMPVRDCVVFPFTRFALGTKSPMVMRAIEKALTSDQKVFVAAQREINGDEPTPEQIYPVGTICTILQSKESDRVIEVLVAGQERGVAVRLENTNGFSTAYVRPATALIEEDEAAVNTLEHRVNQLVEQFHKLQQHAVTLNLSPLADIKDPLQLVDIMARQMLT